MHKRNNWHLHENPNIFIQSWALQRPKDIFYFHEISEINGMQMPFTINIIKINSMSIDAFMWLQRYYFNGCHIWHQWHEVSFVHFDAFWCWLHKCSSSMNDYESINGWGFAWVVKTSKSKDVVIHVELEILLFDYWQCPTRTKGITMNNQPSIHFNLTFCLMIFH
jgi:hypothetical protein